MLLEPLWAFAIAINIIARGSVSRCDESKDPILKE